MCSKSFLERRNGETRNQKRKTSKEKRQRRRSRLYITRARGVGWGGLEHVGDVTLQTTIIKKERDQCNGQERTF